MAERLAYRRRAFLGGYGTLGFMPFGPGETAAAVTNVSAGVATGTGTAHDPTVSIGATTEANAGVAEGTGVAESASAAVAATAGVAEGTGTAPAAGVSVFVYPGVAEGTGTAHSPSTSIAPEIPYAIGWGYALGPDVAIDGILIIAPPEPLLIMLDSVDISAITLTGFSFDSTLGAVPQLTLSVVDNVGIVPWPLTRLAEFTMGTAIDPNSLVDGQLVRWTRKPLFPGMEYGFTIEGWQRLLALSPVQPLTTAVTTVTTPNGIDVTPFGAYIGQGDGPPPTDQATIISAFSGSWRGPALTTMDVPYRHSIDWTIRPNGAPLSSVLDDIAAHEGGDDLFWIDRRTFHWRPGYRGGIPAGHLRAPVAHIESYRLTDDFTAVGGVVPTSIVDAGEGGGMRRGAYVTGRIPAANASVWAGPDYGGMDTMSVDSDEVGIPYLLGLAYMADRVDWRVGLTAELPPGSPVPRRGYLLGVKYGDLVPSLTYYLIRAVRGRHEINGAGIESIAFTLDLGDAERRSYVYERAKVEEATEATKQVVGFEVGALSWMGYDSRQTVSLYPLGADRNRLRLREGTVELHLIRNGTDIGAGDTDVGWWITEGQTVEIIWNENQQLGFASCEVNCGPDPATSGMAGPLDTDAMLLDGVLL